jgi:GNAT superfamily N-acetyltransferase
VKELRLEMSRFLTQASGKGRVVTLYHGQSLVGVIGVTYLPRRERAGLVGTITVHPKHQGRGLSALLYHEALAAMQADGATWYYGYSATERVLSQAKRMKRRVAHVVLTDAPR